MQLNDGRLDMRIALVASLIGLFTLFGAFESKAQSRPGSFPNSGFCPEGTQPKAQYGPGTKVPDVTKDCVPSSQGQQKKKK
jgi:hypothetical protein